jgi:2-oxoisovalerate ferredoxin oxidoreductase beta subunit
MKAQVLGKPRSFYDKFERKGKTHQETTHYCPGCGHGNIHKILAEAVDEYNIADRTILVSPVGCSVFAYYYFDIGNIQAAHGRAPAVATGLKRANPEMSNEELGVLFVKYHYGDELADAWTTTAVRPANATTAKSLTTGLSNPKRNGRSVSRLKISPPGVISLQTMRTAS